MPETEPQQIDDIKAGRTRKELEDQCRLIAPSKQERQVKRQAGEKLALLAYLAGNDDPVAAPRRKFDAFSKISTGRRCALAIQWDGVSPDKSQRPVHRFLNKNNRRWLTETGSEKPASSESLARFLRWGISRIPAEKYILIIGGHSDGFVGMFEDEIPGGLMSLPGLAEALSQVKKKTGRNIDMLIFDSCWMSMFEVLYEIHEYCDVCIGSQEEMLGGGIPIEVIAAHIMTLLDRSEGADTRTLISSIMEDAASTPLVCGEKLCFSPTLSAVCMDRIPDLKKALQDVAHCILLLSESELTRLLQVLKKAQRFGNFAYPEEPYRSFVDIFDLCELMLYEPSLPGGLKGSAAGAARIIERMMAGHVQWGNETAHSHGISIFLPFESQMEKTLSIYSRLRWARESQWEKVMELFLLENERRGRH